MARLPTLELALFALCLVTVSCDWRGLPSSGGSAPAVIDTINGVIVVTNAQGTWSDSTRWTVEERFRVGSADGPAETTFHGPIASVTIGPSGNIFVLEAQAPSIKVFTRDGRFVRTFGRAGRGPGELNAPVAMGWDSMQRLWVADGFGGRYTVFDTAGTFIRTVARPARAQARVQHALLFTGRGSFIDESSDGESITFFRVDTLGNVLESLAPLNHIIVRRSGERTFIPPDVDRTLLNHRSTRIWNLARDGTLWFGESGALRYIQRTLIGDTLRIIEATHRDPSVDVTTRATIEREFRRIGLDPNSSTIARPLSQALYVLDDGHLLVQIADPIDAPGRVFDVYDSNGRFLGPLDFGFRISTRSVPAFLGDTIIAVAIEEELDIPYLVRAVIRRSGM